MSGFRLLALGLLGGVVGGGAGWQQPVDQITLDVSIYLRQLENIYDYVLQSLLGLG